MSNINIYVYTEPGIAQVQNLLSTAFASGKQLLCKDQKKRTRVSDTQLDTEITEDNCNDLARFFENVETYLSKLGLTAGQETDVRDLAFRRDTETAMAKALRLWRKPNPSTATFRALLKILQDLRKGDVADRVCQYIIEEVPNSKE